MLLLILKNPAHQLRLVLFTRVFLIHVRWLFWISSMFSMLYPRNIPTIVPLYKRCIYEVDYQGYTIPMGPHRPPFSSGFPRAPLLAFEVVPPVIRVSRCDDPAGHDGTPPKTNMTYGKSPSSTGNTSSFMVDFSSQSC